MGGGEIFAIIAFAVVAIGVFLFKQSRLNDPSNTSFIYLDQMQGSHQIRPGPAYVRLYRQSGNEYRDLGAFESTQAAISEIEKSFRRAGIDSVSVLKNTTDRYEVIRLHHGHGGKAEGKKLGGAVMVPIDVPQAHVAPAFVKMTVERVESTSIPKASKPVDAGGALGHYGLREWWEGALTHDEKQAMRSAFAQPWGQSAAGNPLLEGPPYHSTETVVAFLTGRAGWFYKAENRSVAFKLLGKAEELVSKEENILTIHFLYHQKILSFYRWRDEFANALEAAIEGCRQQIEIGPQAVIAFKKEFSDEFLPSHTGFKQLSIIEEKSGNYAEVIRLCELAESQGWAGDWLHRAERAAKRQAKPAKA
jgi:hypothetical protein